MIGFFSDYYDFSDCVKCLRLVLEIVNLIATKKKIIIKFLPNREFPNEFSTGVDLDDIHAECAMNC